MTAEVILLYERSSFVKLEWMTRRRREKTMNYDECGDVYVLIEFKRISINTLDSLFENYGADAGFDTSFDASAENRLMLVKQSCTRLNCRKATHSSRQPVS